MGVSKFVENMRAMMEHQDDLFKLNSLSKKEKDAEDIVLSIIPVLVFWCYLFIVVIVLTILGGSFLTLFLTISVPILIWVMFCLGMGVTNLIGMESKGRELLLAVPEFVYFTVWGVASVALLVMVRTMSMPLIDLINTVNPCLFLGLCCNCCAFIILCRDAWKTDPQPPFDGIRKKIVVLLCLSIVNAFLWLVAYVWVLLSLQ